MQKEEYTIITGIVITVIVFLLISLFIFILVVYINQRKKKFKEEKSELEKQYREELLQSQLETQEYSFNQISQELHDNIGQLLSSTKMLLNIGAMELQTVPDSIKTAEQTVAKAIQDLRSLSKSLNKEWLDQFDLIENVNTERERINATRNIEVTLDTTYQKLPLEPESQVMLFRVVQEALQNSIRHASPKHISVEIKNTDHYFELTIQDDGKGFDINSAKKESLGLRNMEHRVQLLGGTITWRSEADKGTLITIKIPVKEST
jgi:signal transduction histidine kinase